jgi:hypothetical protein
MNNHIEELCEEMENLSLKTTMKLVEKTMNEFKTELENKFSKMFNKLYQEKYNQLIQTLKTNEEVIETDEEKEEKPKKEKAKKTKEEKEKCIYMITDKKTKEEKRCLCNAVSDGYCNRHKKIVDKANQEEKETKETKPKKTKDNIIAKNEKKTKVPNSTFDFNNEDEDNFPDIYNDDNNFWSTKSLTLKNNNIEHKYRIHLETNLLFPENMLNNIINKKPVYLLGRLVDDSIVNNDDLTIDIKEWCEKCNIIVDQIEE